MYICDLEIALAIDIIDQFEMEFSGNQWILQKVGGHPRGTRVYYIILVYRTLNQE